MSETVKFGTSGLRGPAEAVAERAGAYCAAFLHNLGAAAGGAVCLGRDLRASSPDIARRVADAVTQAGYDCLDCGPVPTPALAHFALQRALPAIMVTGSHIPADRNGLKFFSPAGEITKDDEAEILRALDRTPPFSALPSRGRCVNTHQEAEAAYGARFRALLPDRALAGLAVGVFEHSTILGAWLASELERLGARVARLGRSEDFVPVDTEAFGDPVFAPLAGWVDEHQLDALVSADGDGDRPLLMDETGTFVRGDALGALAARALGAGAVATPVTANSGLENALAPTRLVRTRVGSPYVLAAMAELEPGGGGPVIGFEANGGVMLGSPVPARGLTALPTRDALLPILLVLGAAAAERRSVSALVGSLALRPARAGRVADMAPSAASALMAALADPGRAPALLARCGTVTATDATDGLRFTLEDGAVIHLRPSGNAPEMRCYTEARDAARADALLDEGLSLIAAARSWPADGPAAQKSRDG